MSVTIAIAETDHELNMSTFNFNALWRALGFDPEENPGEMDPRRLARALKRYVPGSIVRAPVDNLQENGTYFGGVTMDQETRYLGRLARMCHLAESMENKIRWY